MGFRGRGVECLTAFPNVTMVLLPDLPERMLCEKTDMMLAADTEFVTWMNCDIIFLENCRDWLCGEKEAIYCFGYADKSETRGWHCPVPEFVLQTWQRDVGERAIPVRSAPFSPRVIGVHRDNKAFVERWQQLILETARRREVLPTPWQPFFRTLDNDVFNALLLFGEDVPPVSASFRMLEVRNQRYLSFPRSTKPWLRWIADTRAHAPQVWELTRWLVEAGYAPEVSLPRTLKPANSLWQRLKRRIA